MRISLQAFEEVGRAYDEYRREVEAAPMTPATKGTYWVHVDHFIRWLEGKFEPGGRNKDKPRRGGRT